MKTLFMSCIFSLIGFLCAEAQEDQRQESPNKFDISLRGGIWNSDWGFKARTSSKSYEMEKGIMLTLKPSLQYNITERFAVGVAYEHAEGGDIEIDTFGTNGRWTFILAGDDKYVRHQADLTFGIGFGKPTMREKLPGKFDSAFGFSAGFNYSYQATENICLGFELGYRQMKFDFKPSRGVTRADSDIGGGGFYFEVLLFGFSF